MVMIVVWLRIILEYKYGRQLGYLHIATHIAASFYVFS